MAEVDSVARRPDRRLEAVREPGVPDLSRRREGPPARPHRGLGPPLPATDDLSTAIVFPNLDVSPLYQTTAVATRDGPGLAYASSRSNRPTG